MSLHTPKATPAQNKASIIIAISTTSITHKGIYIFVRFKIISTKIIATAFIAIHT